MIHQTDQWDSGQPYEYFMGRWSRLMAPVFLSWLNITPEQVWLDLGCGTGALSQSILGQCAPKQLYCVEPSPEFLEQTKYNTSHQGEYHVGSASSIPLPDQSCDLVVSGIALNFFPDLPAALREIARVVRPGGIFAAYVWDYAGKMEMLRYFWDTAREVDPAAAELDEGARFHICNPEQLRSAFEAAGLQDITTSELDITTSFRDFDDFWQPFLGGQGPAPGYLASLDHPRREAIRSSLQQQLSTDPGQPIHLIARAIAIRGAYPG